MALSTSVAKRFKDFIASSDYKSKLQSALYGVMKEGKSFKLKRNRVLIKDTTPMSKYKFIILDIYENNLGQKYYCCPICSDKKILDNLNVDFEINTLPRCLHSDVCQFSGE